MSLLLHRQNYQQKNVNNNKSGRLKNKKIVYNYRMSDKYKFLEKKIFDMLWQYSQKAIGCLSRII